MTHLAIGESTILMPILLQLHWDAADTTQGASPNPANAPLWLALPHQSVADLARKLRKYIRAYAKSAKPFRWTYTDPRRRIRAYEITGTAY